MKTPVDASFIKVSEMFVSRLGTHHRSAEYIPFIQAVPVLEDVALRHLAMALGGTGHADRKSGNPDAKKARRDEGSRFTANDGQHDFWSVRF